MWTQGGIKFKKGLQHVRKDRIDRGKIHVLVERDGQWFRHCGSSGRNGDALYYGTDVDNTTPLTCEMCKTNWEWSKPT